MTKFEDQLFDDLMREHGPALARVRPPATEAAAKRHVTARRALLATGAGGLTAAAAAGALVATGAAHAPSGTHAAGGGRPAYAVTNNPDGTVTLAVYQASGIAGANARLHQLGDDQVVIVPVGPGCPSLRSLPPPGVPADHISEVVGHSKGGDITVNAQGIPAGDILVVASVTTTNGTGMATQTGSVLTSPPAPSCVSMPAPPPPPAGSGSGSRSGGSA